MRLPVERYKEGVLGANMIVCRDTLGMDRSASRHENSLSGWFCLKSFADKQTPAEFLIRSRQVTLHSRQWGNLLVAGANFDFEFIPKALDSFKLIFV